MRRKVRPGPDRENESRYWLDPGWRGLSLLSADFRTHEYATHTHDALLVAVTEEGGSAIKAGGVPAEVHSAALLVVNPDQPHSSRMLRSKRWRYRSLYLDLEGLSSLSEALGLRQMPSFDENVHLETDLVRDFLRLHRALDGPRDAFRERELLVGAMGRLVRRHGRQRRPVPLPPADRTLLDRALRLLRDRHIEHLELLQPAEALELTQYQLIRLLARGIGMTPHVYLTQVRLDHARDLLRGGLPIAEAALAAGFYDQPALSRHFKRAFGITPRQYALAHRG
ncbi:MAG: AraC family transcriptional regulator [Candidatus Dormibacteraeota bacterium]|nr:AraC family transcriptional regulator [Candidatus Dormibacteraeota bacterium]